MVEPDELPELVVGDDPEGEGPHHPDGTEESGRPSAPPVPVDAELPSGSRSTGREVVEEPDPRLGAGEHWAFDKRGRR